MTGKKFLKTLPPLGVVAPPGVCRQLGDGDVGGNLAHTHAVSAFAAPAEKQLVAHPPLLRSRLSGSSAPFGFLWCQFVQIVGEWG